MLALREIRRFFRTHRWLTLFTVAILSLGLCLCGLTLTLVLGFSSLSSPGLRALHFATTAEVAGGGAAGPIDWSAFQWFKLRSPQKFHPAAYSRRMHVTLRVPGSQEPLDVAATSSAFFSVYTRKLAAGRDFEPGEEQQAGQHVAILSFSLAQQLYGSPSQALGHYIGLNGLAFRVIGVAPRHFYGIFGEAVSAWVPANCIVPLDLKLLDPADQTGAESAHEWSDPDVWKQVPAFYALSASGSTSVSNILRRLTPVIEAATKERNGLRMYPGLSTDPVRDLKLKRWARLAFLLISILTAAVCLNFCGLLLARAPKYFEEVRLKQTFGAANGRIVVELACGPAFTIGIAFVLASAWMLAGLYRISRISPFWHQTVLGSLRPATVALGIVFLGVASVGLALSVVPALRLVRDAGQPRLGYTATRSRGLGRTLQGIAIVQIAGGMTAVVLASMVFSTAQSVLESPLGFQPRNLFAVCIQPPESASFSMTVRSHGEFPMAAGMSQLLAQIQEMPGIRHAAIAMAAPYDQPIKSLRLESMNGAARTSTVSYVAASQDYFSTVGARILLGTGFSSQTMTGDVTEVVINRALWKELWPGEAPLNRTLRLTLPATGIAFTARVTGVVEDARFSSLNAAVEPAVFLPLKGLVFTLGMPLYVIADGTADSAELQARVSKDLATLLPGLQAQYAYRVQNKVNVQRQQLARREYLSIGNALAIALIAYVGLYGALIFYVSAEQKELTLRLCFGASRWRIRLLVLRKAAVCALVAYALSAALWPLLASVSNGTWLGQIHWSMPTAALVTTLCACLSAATALLPAEVAARMAPADILRAE